MFRFCRAEPGQPTCFILGQRGDKVEFDSRRLRTQQAFTHFFLTAGEHSYHMGRGIYQISVTDHREFAVEEHKARASDAVVIIVNGGDPSLKHAKIVTGQTIIWAVEKGENVSIEGESDDYLKVGGLLYTFITLKDPPDATHPGILREILNVDFPIVVNTEILIPDQAKVISQYKWRQRKMMAAQRDMNGGFRV